ncbi:hypothetical protein ZWY2020_008678 [Hordeum vulgare]|nr:hypothetical protein ZWY2020_008678 [Hordeum vulgare]
MDHGWLVHLALLLLLLGVPRPWLEQLLPVACPALSRLPGCPATAARQSRLVLASGELTKPPPPLAAPSSAAPPGPASCDLTSRRHQLPRPVLRPDQPPPSRLAA